MIQPRPLIHPRDELVASLDRIYRHRMTTTSGGNLSIRDENGAIWITPARIDKGSLRASDIVRVAPDGSPNGLHPPSSEFPFHRAVYEVRPDIHAMIHAHPVALVAFSICGEIPETGILPVAHEVCGTIGFAPYRLPGSEALGSAIAEAFARGADCVMMENHGVVVGAADFQTAFQRFETLEFCAKTIIKARQAGVVHKLSSEQLELSRSVPEAWPCFTPGPASTHEKDLRTQVAEFVQRGYRQRLMTSSQGTCSARLGDDCFVITCRGVDRAEVTPDSLALMDQGRCEAGKRPSRAAALHRALYAKHPEVRSIINALPVNATAFAVTGAAMDARTIPESYLFVRDAGLMPYGLHIKQPEKAAELLSPAQPAMLLENDGVMVLGRSVLEAFDRLEVLESTAEALINAGQIGPLRPMSHAAIDELISAFQPWT